jgi:putative ABC transport system permease protein
MPDWKEHVRRSLPAVPGRRARKEEVVEEVAQHLANRYEDALARGASEKEARSAALDELRAWNERRRPAPVARSGRADLLADFRSDLRFGLRVLGRNPGFALVAVLTLGIATGANTAVFSVVEAALIRPLPFPAPERLALLWEAVPELGMQKMPFSVPDLDDFIRLQTSFAALAAYENKRYDVGVAGEAQRVMGARLSGTLFLVLGTKPALGRPISPEEDAAGARVVVLSHAYWQRRFGADPQVVGTTVTIDRVPHSVIGVMPAGFRFPPAGPAFNGTPADVFVPMAVTVEERQARGMMFNKNVVGRLRDGVSMREATAEAAVLGARVFDGYPAQIRDAMANASLRIPLVPFHEEISGSSRRLLLVLQAAVAMVLLIACANVANLLLSRAAARRDEMALRTALGAVRSRLVRQTLAESLLLGVSGGALGVVLARLAILLLPALAPTDLPFLAGLRLDGTVLAVTLLVSVSSAVLFGVAPALDMTRGDLHSALRQGGRRTTEGGARRRVQEAFVVGQFALGLVLLVGAGLLIRSLEMLLHTDPGFRPQQVVALTASLPASAYPQADDIRSFYAQLLERLGALPGVTAVGAASDLPLAGTEVRAFEAEEGALGPGKGPGVAHTWMTGDYFGAVGIGLKKGRRFTPYDRTGALPVAIVSESLARLCWPGADPIGKRIRWGAGNAWMTVVGVVGEVKDGPLHTQPRPHTYTPLLQERDEGVADSIVGLLRNLSVAVRAEGEPSTLLSSVRDQARALDPELAIARLRLLTEDLHDTTAPQRFNASVLAAFALAAVFLAAIGVYGVLAASVARQTHEIGVRMALGAKPRDLIQMVGRRGIALASAGLALGLAAAAALSRLISGLLYGVGSVDLVTFASTPLVLMLVAAVACFVPARRATRVDPLVALRHE